MFTCGLPDPTGRCLPDGDCPFVCEDAGPKYACNRCRSFSGGMSWWEGQNAFNRAPVYEFEIHVRGSDEDD